MLYRFNNITNRIVSNVATSLGQGLKRGSVEGSKVYYDSTVKFAPTPVQQMKKTNQLGCGELDPKLVANQKKFQVDDGVPVHLKGGPADKVLFYTTILLSAVVLEECGRFYYKMAYPVKSDE